MKIKKLIPLATLATASILPLVSIASCGGSTKIITDDFDFNVDQAVEGYELEEKELHTPEKMGYTHNEGKDIILKAIADGTVTPEHEVKYVNSLLYTYLKSIIDPQPEHSTLNNEVNESSFTLRGANYNKAKTGRPAVGQTFTIYLEAEDQTTIDDISVVNVGDTVLTKGTDYTWDATNKIITIPSTKMTSTSVYVETKFTGLIVKEATYDKTQPKPVAGEQFKIHLEALPGTEIDDENPVDKLYIGGKWVTASEDWWDNEAKILTIPAEQMKSNQVYLEVDADDVPTGKISIEQFGSRLSGFTYDTTTKKASYSLAKQIKVSVNDYQFLPHEFPEFKITGDIKLGYQTNITNVPLGILSIDTADNSMVGQLLSLGWFVAPNGYNLDPVNDKDWDINFQTKLKANLTLGSSTSPVEFNYFDGLGYDWSPNNPLFKMIFEDPELPPSASEIYEAKTITQILGLVGAWFSIYMFTNPFGLNPTETTNMRLPMFQETKGKHFEQAPSTVPQAPYVLNLADDSYGSFDIKSVGGLKYYDEKLTTEEPTPEDFMYTTYPTKKLSLGGLSLKTNKDDDTAIYYPDFNTDLKEELVKYQTKWNSTTNTLSLNDIDWEAARYFQSSQGGGWTFNSSEENITYAQDLAKLGVSPFIANGCFDYMYLPSRYQPIENITKVSDSEQAQDPNEYEQFIDTEYTNQYLVATQANTNSAGTIGVSPTTADTNYGLTINLGSSELTKLIKDATKTEDPYLFDIDRVTGTPLDSLPQIAIDTSRGIEYETSSGKKYTGYDIDETNNQVHIYFKWVTTPTPTAKQVLYSTLYTLSLSKAFTFNVPVSAITKEGEQPTTYKKQLSFKGQNFFFRVLYYTPEL